MSMASPISDKHP